MNFTIFAITLLIILGFILRTLGIVKTGGLWNDEYISWYISSLPLFKPFIKGILSQCHMPFYYLYLKFFMIFSNNDTFLRFTSVIPAIISIPVMYLVGREKSKLTGLMCALFVSINHFLIYYSQEVRFYSILFLFSAISLLFTLRLVKKQNLNNIIGYVLSNTLIIFTHTIGFVYVFFNILYIFLKLFKANKKLLAKIIGIIFLFFTCSVPLIHKIFSTVSFSQWWHNFSINRLLQIFIDYFSPVISPIFTVENLNGYNSFASFVIISTLIAIITLCIGMFYKKCRNDNQVIYIAIMTLIVVIIAAINGKIALETKYTIEIFPILIYTFINTILSFNKKRIKIPLLLVFFGIQTAYLFSDSAAFWQPRYEGNKFAIDLINNANLNKGDFIVLTYYPKERFEKYFDFSNYNVLEFHKGNFNDYFMPKITYKQAVKYGQKEYRGSLINDIKPLKEYDGNPIIYEIDKNVYRIMKPNQKVVFIFLDSVSFLDETTFNKIVTNNEMYYKTPLMYLIFSDIRNSIIRTIPLKARKIRYESLGSWTAVSFER